ncbi:MAG: glycosyltransferase family 4 protein [Bacteroidales bacterium]|nr:glycosyltransferase family 4 protein [Bacteroidales bacterium]
MSIIESVVFVAPCIDIDERTSMGWSSDSFMKDTDVRFVIAPSDDDVKALLSSADVDTYCSFCGINAFKIVAKWFKLSLSVNVHRVIITEPPCLNKFPLWMHAMRFALTDWKYVKYIDKIYVMGQDFVRYYKFWSSRWQVIPFMYCTQWNERSIPVPSDSRLKVLFVGALSKRKNVDLLLNASVGLCDISLGIVGDGEQREPLVRLSEENGLDTTFYGSLPMSKVTDIMQRYDVLVLPSHHDGWGAVVNEAMTLGLYVLCSDHCGAKMLIADDDIGRVFSSDSKSELSDMLRELSSKKEEVRNFAKHRVEWSRENISGKAVAEYFISHLL